MSRSLLVVLLGVLLAVPAGAHGGIYLPPSDSGGPGGKPPIGPGGSSPPGAGSPPTAGSHPASGPPATGAPHAGGRPGMPSATGGPPDESFAWDSWVFWWEYNKDRFLVLHDRLAQQHKAVSGSAGPLTGIGRPGETISARRPDPEDVRRTLLPELRALLAHEHDRDIVDSASLALARSVVDDRDADEAALVPLLAHPELNVQTAAALSLGVLGTRTAVPLLLELASGAAAGRAAVGGGAVPPQVRSFATLALGLSGDPSVAGFLCDLAQHLPDSDRDLRVAAVTALGLLPPGAHERAVATLDALLADRRLDATLRAQVPVALARLDAVEELPRLLALFTARDTDDLVRESLAIALGRLGGVTDAAVTGALLDCVTQARDAATRHFALIALGDLGARDADDAQAHDAQHAALSEALLRQVAHPSFREQRPWAGLAAAIHGRAVPSVAPGVIDALRVAWRDESDPLQRGAYALGLGLLDDRGSADDLLAAWKTTHEDTLRGYVGLALGFLGHEPAREPLRALCASRLTAPTLRLQSATALGLLSDEPAVPVLVGALQDAQTDGVASACARSLGLIGDRLALPPLLALAADSSRPPSARAFACVALGLLAERGELSWHARLRAGVNYCARSAVLDEVLDIL